MSIRSNVLKHSNNRNNHKTMYLKRGKTVMLLAITITAIWLTIQVGIN